MEITLGQIQEHDDLSKGRMAMALCERCNAKLSFAKAYVWGERLCESCERQMYYEKAKQEYQTRMDRERAETERIRRKADARVRALTESVSNGHDIFMFKSVIVPAGSIRHGSPSNLLDVSQIQSLGLEGWEVVSAVPIIDGVVGGTGGGLEGVAFMMKKRVSQAEPLLAERISEYVHSLPDWVKTGERPEDEAGGDELASGQGTRISD